MHGNPNNSRDYFERKNINPFCTNYYAYRERMENKGRSRSNTKYLLEEAYKVLGCGLVLYPYNSPCVLIPRSSSKSCAVAECPELLGVLRSHEQVSLGDSLIAPAVYIHQEM